VIRSRSDAAASLALFVWLLTLHGTANGRHPLRGTAGKPVSRPRAQAYGRAVKYSGDG